MKKNDSCEKCDYCNSIRSQLEAALSSTYDGFYITDGNGVFLKVNSGAERISGIKKEEVIGITAQSLVEKGLIDHSIVKEVIERKERFTIIQTLNRTTKKEVITTATPILDEEGNIKYIVANLRDMTELNQLKYEYEKARQLSNQYYLELIKEKGLKEKLISESVEMRRVLELAYRVSQVDSTILLEGESGVGKEVVSQYIHEMSFRNKGPFISINCAAIPENLMEAELFGYEKGAFTGANREGKLGLIELANDGTLFLDEINSFPIALQGKILRVIETLEVSHLGSTKVKKVNFRLITATNKDLKKLVREGLFRKDLYFRLKVVPISIPPLRERKKDIIPLAIHFLQLFNKKYMMKKELSHETLNHLENYHWPGNVRELKNLIERLVVMSPYTLISSVDLPSEFLHVEMLNDDFKIIINDIIPLKQFLSQAERLLVEKAIKKYGSTRSVAKALEISQSSVVRKMHKTIYIRSEMEKC